MHRKFWIPLFGKSVLAGLEVNNWKFLKPVYPNREIECWVNVLSRKLNSDQKTATIKWRYEFKESATMALLQSLEMTILHKA
jgi:acyl dehydratase